MKRLFAGNKALAAIHCNEECQYGVVIYRVSQKKCNIAISRLDLFWRSDLTFSHMFQNQNSDSETHVEMLDWTFGSDLSGKALCCIFFGTPCRSIVLTIPKFSIFSF